MFRFSSRAAAIALAVAATSSFAAVTITPAAALCRYGSPNCVNPRPNFDYEMEEEVTLDSVSDGWQDQDCKFYGNCLADNQEQEDRAGAGNGNGEEEARNPASDRPPTFNRSALTRSVQLQQRR